MLLALLLTAAPTLEECVAVEVQQGLQSVVRCTGDNTVFSVQATGSNLQYSWTSPSGPVAGANGPSLTVENIDLEDRGLWCVTVSNDCSVEMSCARISVQECGSEYCTLTQGAYGSNCGYFNGMSRPQLIKSLLGNEPLTVGVVGARSLTIPTGLAAANCIILRLPATSTPKALPSGFGDKVLQTSTCQTTTPLPLQNGRFKNVLLGQTIALSLNLRLSPNLASVPLCPNVVTSNGVAHIPLSVLAAMLDLGYGHSVDGLLQFANRALAGQSTGVASLSDINCAISNINCRFDECATLIGCQ